jgi:hypothetical protein
MAEGQSRSERVVLSSCLGIYVWACFGLLLVLPINVIAIVAGAVWLNTCESGVLFMTVGEWVRPPLSHSPLFASLPLSHSLACTLPPFSAYAHIHI